MIATLIHVNMEEPVQMELTASHVNVHLDILGLNVKQVSVLVSLIYFYYQL